MILIGFIAYRATRNFDDYISGTVAVSAVSSRIIGCASDMSGCC